MGRTAVEIELTTDERNELVGLTRRKKTAQQVAMRARIMSACAEGLENKVVAERKTSP